MNDRYTHRLLKPLEDAVSVLPSFTEESKEDGQEEDKSMPQEQLPQNDGHSTASQKDKAAAGGM